MCLADVTGKPSQPHWMALLQEELGLNRGKGEGTKGEKMVIAALGDISGGCETAAWTCSARYLKLNECLDLIERGPEKSVTTT